jgi:FkbM family methyltransferase
MATIKRMIANALGRALDVSIVPKGGIAPLFEIEHLKRFFEEFAVDCVFDVVANAGQYAETLREFGYTGSIVSFEPIPALAAQLREKAHPDGRWFVEEVALDETVRAVSFNVMESSQFSSLKAPSQEETAQFANLNVVAHGLDVTTAQLATYFARYQGQLAFRRPFLKMDTQGNDLAVARGAGTHLAEFVGLQSELAIKRIYAGSDDYRAALDFYQSAGFELSAFVPNNYGHFPMLVEMDCIMFNRTALPD